MLSFAIVSKDHQPTNPVSSLNMNKLDFYDFMVLTVLAFLFHFSLFFYFRIILILPSRVFVLYCLNLWYDTVSLLQSQHCVLVVSSGEILDVNNSDWSMFFPTSKFQNIQPFFIVWLWWIGIFPLSLYIKCSVEWFF